MYFGESFSSKLPWEGDPEAHFNEDILHLADGISNSSGTVSGWLVFCLLIVWVAIYFSIWKGVKSTGNVVMITAPLPLILLIILFFRGITLPGAGTGIKYFLEPDFRWFITCARCSQIQFACIFRALVGCCFSNIFLVWTWLWYHAGLFLLQLQNARFDCRMQVLLTQLMC